MEQSDVDSLSDAELNALSVDGLEKLADGAALEDLGQSDLQALSDLNEDNTPSWFQENIGRPIADKAGEIAGALGSLSSSSIRSEALNKMIQDGSVSAEEVAGGKVEPGFGNKLGAASEMFLQNAFDSLRVEEGQSKEAIKSRANPEILADMQAMDYMDASLASMNAVAMAKGQAYTWEDGNAGILEKVGNTLTAGEQFVARGALTALSQIGVIPREDAIQMLSQTQVHASDLVDHFWIPESAAGKIGRGVVGFAADVAIDPLSYLTLGAGPALRAAFKDGAVKVGNRVISDPRLVSRLERQALLAERDVINIVRKSGKIESMEATEDALQTLNKAVSDKGLAGLDGTIVERFSAIDPTLGEQVKGVFQARQREKSALRSLADKDTSLNFAFRLPLTNMAVETEMPLFGQGTRWGSQAALGVKDWSFDSAARVAGAMAEKSEGAKWAIQSGQEVGDFVSNTFQAFKTFTTRPLWDSASNGFLNKKYGNQIWAKRQMDEAIKETGNDPETARLMVQWLNQEPTLGDGELLDRFLFPEADEFTPYLTDYPSLPPRIMEGGNLGGVKNRVKDVPTKKAKIKSGDEIEISTEFRNIPNLPYNMPREAVTVVARKDGAEIGHVYILGDSPILTQVDGAFRRQGVATNLYDYINENIVGISPSPYQTTDGVSFWQNRKKTKPPEDSFTPIKPSDFTKKEVQFKGELRTARQMAQDTMTRLEISNPKAAKRVRQIREQFVDRVYEMEKRGIPFRVLNPFDETIPVNERAFGYFPHIMNPDYLDDLGRPKYEAALNAFEDHQIELGLVDSTQVGRRDRRSTQTIIDSVKKASGVDAPIFINDPISASYSRMEDMDNIIAQYDMFNDILPLAKVVRPGPALKGIAESRGMSRLTGLFQDQDPGRGWVKFDARDFSSPVMKKYGGAATVESTTTVGKVRDKVIGKEFTEEIKSKEFLQFKSFLPQEYKTALAEGASIYFPDDVATRIGYIMQRPKSGIANSALDAWNYWFMNGALFGTGYQGMNTLSNLTTYMTARADLVKIPQATKFLFDAQNNAAKIRNKTYTFGKGASQLSMNGEELYDLAAKSGILSNSSVSEADIISDVWDQIATTKSTRDKLRYRVKNRVDTYTGFKWNRHIAESSDNGFRMGLFMDSLDKGYSLKAAKERVDMYFYDFRDMPQGQRFTSAVVPFSSFLSKTAESVAQRAAKLDLTPITLPFYVSEVLDGAFVDSYEERKFLKANLPFYADHYELGDALPGGKQLVVEFPFIINSVKTFLNPEDSVNQLIQSLALATTAISQANSPDDPDFDAAQMDSQLFKSKWDTFLGDQLRMLLPPTVKMPLTLAQLGSPDEVRQVPLDFVKQYKGKSLIEAANAGNAMQSSLSLNAQEFGKFAREQSPNWLYNSIMYGQLRDPYLTDEDSGAEKDAMYGRFVKSRMRDLSFGLVRMQNMDTAIVTRMAAVQRQMAKTKQRIQRVNIDANVLRDPLASPKLKMKLAGRADEATNVLQAEMIELAKRQAALRSFYGYYISQQKSGGMAIEMFSNAINPEQPLTEQEAQDQNDLIEVAPDMIPGRVKKLELQMMGEQ